MLFARFAAWWRSMSPGGSAAAQIGGVVFLLLLGITPFAWLSITAPSEYVEDPRSPEIIVMHHAPGPADPEEPPVDPAETGAAALLENPEPVRRPPPESPPPVRAGPPAGHSGQSGSDFRGADFDLQCWPVASVIPGRSATVDCVVPVHNGFDSQIQLECRIQGMECSFSPDVVQPAADLANLYTKLVIAAPASAEVGDHAVSVAARAQDRHGTTRESRVKVSVPPPFTVACESVGATFIQGEGGAMKCWVSFLDGFSDEVAIRIADSAGVPATLEATALAPAPNQTLAFNIEVDTERLDARVYVLQVEAASPRYQQQAPAVLRVLP